LPSSSSTPPPQHRFGTHHKTRRSLH
jgi:hypothetical protein